MRASTIVAILLVSSTAASVVSGAELGIGYGLIGPFNGQSFVDGLRKLKNMGFYKLKTWSLTDGRTNEWLSAVREVYGSSAKVTVAIPNGDPLRKAASNDGGYMNEVKNRLNQYRDIINLVALGNEPYLSGGSAIPHFVSAARNMHNLLRNNGLLSSMKITVPFSGAVLRDTWPVENANFKPEALQQVKDVLSLINEEGSVFSINLYPFFALGPDVSVDAASGPNLEVFTNMLRGARVALRKAGYPNVPIIVGETGWPSGGGNNANVGTASAYNNHLINYVKNTDLARAVYIFEAFDEAGKPAGVEQHWGIATADGRMKYQLANSAGGGGGGGGGGGQGINWQAGNWAMNCDFYGNDMGKANPIRGEDCGGRCASTGGCTHFTWTDYEGGTCWMKRGHIQKGQAVYKQGAVCGIGEQRGANGINWQAGNWAMNCDFYGNDMGKANPIRGEDCGGWCASTGGCTHFTWTDYEGGTCWMKRGHIQKSQAVYKQGAVCGIK